MSKSQLAQPELLETGCSMRPSGVTSWTIHPTLVQLTLAADAAAHRGPGVRLCPLLAVVLPNRSCVACVGACREQTARRVCGQGPTRPIRRAVCTARHLTSDAARSAPAALVGELNMQVGHAATAATGVVKNCADRRQADPQTGGTARALPSSFYQQCFSRA